MNMNPKQTKNCIDRFLYGCNFCHFSFLFPCPNKFLVVCLCILIFHGIYPPNHKYFFVGLKCFSYLVARGWENFKFLGDLLYWGELIFFLGEGSRPFCSIKPSMTNHVNSRIVDGKIICFMCIF